MPFDQCLPHEVLSRKDDGYAIDPRNSFKANIEAIGSDDVVITDGNGTIVSVKKLQDISAESTTEDNTEKTRKRRDSNDDNQENKINAVSVNFVEIFTRLHQ